MSPEQRNLLECAARWIWNGAQPATDRGRDRFRYWERRVTRAAVRWLNACDSPRARVTPETLKRMLATLPPSPPSRRTARGTKEKR